MRGTLKGDDGDIVRLCLTLWCRSAKGYTHLRNSQFLILPSEKLLQRYKNTVGDHFIEWSHFRRAYLWDISTHPFPVHHKLSQDHIYLTSEAKMRNHLAEQILNEEMLHLMNYFNRIWVKAALS